MRTPIRIGYLIQDFPPEVGAGPARAYEMAKRWADLGADVTVITAMPNRRIPGRGDGGIAGRYKGKLFMEENWHGIRILRSWLYTGNGRGFSTKIINNVSFMITAFLQGGFRRLNIDVLIASSPPFLPHVSGVFLGKLLRVPLILEIRDMWPDYLVALGILKTGRTSEMLFRLERWLLCNANRVVVVTNSFRQRLESKGVTLDRIDIVPNGVDVQHYRKREEPPPLAAMQARTNELIVGYLGTFGKGQALHIVIEAAALLRAWGHTIRFVFAGDGPELQRLVEAAKSLNADSDLVGLYPPIPREQTRAFYNSCDICVVPLAPVPIFDETVPSKLFEIMACETPLVASVGGEAADIVRKSGGGIVTRPGDPVALAEAILAIANLTENERMTMGRNAREFVRLNYDRISIADRYFEILHSLASAKQ